MEDVKTDLLGLGGPVATSGHLHRHRADPGHHLALRPVAVVHDARAAIFGLVIGIGGKQSCQLRLHRLLDQAKLTRAQDLRQRIVRKSPSCLMILPSPVA